MKKFFKFFLGKTQLQAFYRGLFLVGLKGMNFGGGSTWSESGEEWVISYFARLAAANSQEIVFFDVGANIGEYALAVWAILKRQNLKGKIYCFEPSQKTFAMLEKTTAPEQAVECFNLALSDKPGQAALFVDQPGSGLASLYDRDLKNHGVVMKAQEQVQVQTLENFCQERGIQQIDFLKLDVEGNEYKVLLGAGEMLKQRKIKFIQFEFGGTDVDARVFFRDFYRLLSPNYLLFRILKNGLCRINGYSELDEIFITTNYLAVLKSG